MSFNTNLGPTVSNGFYLRNKLRNFKNNIAFGHLNCQSIRPSAYNSKVDELKNILLDSGINLFAISETWLKPYVSTSSLSIPGYSFVRNDRPHSRGGGVGFYVYR